MTTGITNMVNQRAGLVPPPAASVQDVSQALRQTLEQLLQVKQTETVADAVKSLISKKEEGASPFAGLKDLGLDVKSLLDANTSMTKVALDQLNKERERVLEEKEKALASEKHERAQELSVAEKLMGLVINTQNRSFEQQIELLKEMQKERIEHLKESGKKPESDELTQFMKVLSIKLLEEKLNKPVPDVRSEIRNYLEIARDLGNMLGGSRVNDKAAEFNYQIEMKKIELEATKLEKELEHKRQSEERKLATWSQFVQQLSQLLPAALQAMQARSHAPQPVSGMVTAQRICPVCGEGIPMGAVSCPRCGKDAGLPVGERTSVGAEAMEV